MTFVAIPDGQVDRSVMAALESRFGSPLVRHLSGRPWIFADRAAVGDVQAHETGVVSVRMGTSDGAVPSEPALGTSCWTLVSRDDSSEARGSLSSSHRICWTTQFGTVLISDRADTLAEIVGSRIDPVRLMLAMCDSLSSLPFGASSYWHDVAVLLPGEVLRVSPSGVQRERWWRAPVANLNLEEAALEVRAALLSAVLETTEGAESVSCDLSGGLDSTSLVFLLNEVGADFSTFSSFSHDTRNPDREWARRTVDRLARVDHTELTSSSETLRAFGLDGVPGKTDEPLLWKSNIAYLREVAAALASHASPVHLNGLGGDELFTFLPGALHAAWQAGLPDRRRLAARARAMNRWDRSETACKLRRNPSFGEHLRLQGAAVVAHGSSSGPAVCSWLPPVHVSRFATDAARSTVADALSTVPTDLEPHASTHGHHQVMEGVVFQGRAGRRGPRVRRPPSRRRWWTPSGAVGCCIRVRTAPGTVRWSSPPPRTPGRTRRATRPRARWQRAGRRARRGAGCARRAWT